MRILSKKFYNRDPIIVARELLGKILVRNINGKVISGRIVETEAYLGFNDEAAHSFIGKTNRNKSLFGPPGMAYIYRIHMQYCVNAVTNEIDDPGGVLIRALEPIEGIEEMKRNREKENLKDLTSGPGKLCKALNITLEQDGVDLKNKKSPIYIVEDNYKSSEIVSSKRIGISKAAEHEWRFYIKGNGFISKK